MAVVVFPGVVRRVPIGPLRCEGCQAPCFIFADTRPVRGWCSPWCAAAAGVMPWAGCAAEDRVRWPAPGEAVSLGGVA